ncbi:hypothetical protein F5Y08DRAFT_340838 [Xylaria arbuscula]|nr:hypothetical protein F5Y08DRAFT_340838 [Xylaria arbuscula]
MDSIMRESFRMSPFALCRSLSVAPSTSCPYSLFVYTFATHSHLSLTLTVLSPSLALTHHPQASATLNWPKATHWYDPFRRYPSYQQLIHTILVAANLRSVSLPEQAHRA